MREKERDKAVSRDKQKPIERSGFVTWWTAANSNWVFGMYMSLLQMHIIYLISINYFYITVLPHTLDNRIYNYKPLIAILRDTIVQKEK
jgi:hypothetical protein